MAKISEESPVTVVIALFDLPSSEFPPRFPSRPSALRPLLASPPVGLWWEFAFFNQRSADQYSGRSVQAQDEDRGAAGGSEPDQPRAVPCEVVIPTVLAGIEQGGDAPRIRVDAGNVRTLPEIALQATKGQVVFFRLTAMLSGGDVVDLEPLSIEGLGRVAVLAPAPCSSADAPVQRSSDPAHARDRRCRFFSERRALDWTKAMKWLTLA